MPSIRALKRRHDQRRRHQLAVWRAPPALTRATPYPGRRWRLMPYQAGLLQAVARALRLPPALLLRRAVPPRRRWSACAAVWRACSSRAPVYVDPWRQALALVVDGLDGEV